MKKIYLAGPEVFLPNPISEGKKLKELCSKFGFIGVFPLDNEIKGTSALEISTKIRNANKELIKACDIIIANVSPFRGPEPDSGTVWEIGFAQGLNKKVVCYSSDRRTLKEKTQSMLNLGDSNRDLNGMEIEDFGLTHNLMFSDLVLGPNIETCLHFLQISEGKI